MSKKGLLALDDFERAMTKEIPLRMTVKAGKVMDEKKKQAAFLARQVVLGLRMQWDSEQLIGHPGDPKKEGSGTIGRTRLSRICFSWITTCLTA